LKNNHSALEHTELVDTEINKLLLRGVIKQSSNLNDTNPLTVAENFAGKLRLVIDLRDFNHCWLLEKYKYEGIINVLCKLCVRLFSFNLRLMCISVV
jgi:hypothetical protein